MINNPKPKKDSPTELSLAKSLEKLVDGLLEITEYSSRQLLPISLLQTDIYFSELLKFYVINKKHVKRKHSKELLKALEDIAKTIGARLESKDDSGGFMNMFSRK